MLTSPGVHALADGSHFQVTAFEGLVIGAVLGAVLAFFGTVALDVLRAKRERASRFLDERRLAYARFLGCCDSIRVALRAFVAAKDALDEATEGQAAAFANMKTALEAAGPSGDTLRGLALAGESIDSEAFQATTGALIAALRSQDRAEATRATEEFALFQAAFANLKRLSAASLQASERASDAIDELGATIVDIELVGPKLLGQARKVLEAVSGLPHDRAQLEAADSARAQFSVAARADIAS